MKLVYITAQAPYGKGEKSIMEGMLEVKKLVSELIIIPRNPDKKVFHNIGRALAHSSIWLPLINIKIIIFFLISFLVNPKNLARILVVISKESPNIKFLLKNLCVFPKAVYISNLLLKKKISHIHAHWTSTTSTMAYISSQLTGIPWSFTAHSGMILFNNMLKEKVKSASFVRVISETRYKDIVKLVGIEYKDKIFVSHVGIRMFPYNRVIPKALNHSTSNTIGCIAALNRIKGHKYLIEACHILKEEGYGIKCLLIGEGEERKTLENLIQHFHLKRIVELIGAIPNEKIIEMLSNQKIDALILPSITLPKEKRAEGIPIALVEAMAHGVPTISTNTGSIPELLKDGAGIMVPERDSEALATAIKKVLTDQELRRNLIWNAFEQVYYSDSFNVERSSRKLVKYFDNIK